MPNTVTYFDITIGGAPAGRITFELFDDVVPKVSRDSKGSPVGIQALRSYVMIGRADSFQTTENFKHLCIGDKTNKDGVKLAYAGSGFHRCIKG
jgi:peptidyl-prolyl isomerase D